MHFQGQEFPRVETARYFSTHNSVESWHIIANPFRLSFQSGTVQVNKNCVFTMQLAPSFWGSQWFPNTENWEILLSVFTLFENCDYFNIQTKGYEDCISVSCLLGKKCIHFFLFVYPSNKVRTGWQDRQVSACLTPGVERRADNGACRRETSKESPSLLRAYWLRFPYQDLSGLQVLLSYISLVHFHSKISILKRKRGTWGA